MAGLLFGAETEYAVSDGRNLNPRPGDEPAQLLLRRARERLIWLPDAHGPSGVYLSNGARLYIDCGTHPEYCTPECDHPLDVVRHVEAGHRILAALACDSDAKRSSRDESILCFRSNVDYSGSLATWGAHESYMHKTAPDRLRPQLIPHFVTRPIYTGAGGFNPKAQGLEFSLSPRLCFFHRVISDDTVNERGIWSARSEPLARGYGRLHVTCGESLCSQTALYLKFGVTALIVAMADAGIQPGAGMRLSNAVSALRTVISDSTLSCRLPLAGDRALTAIEIQRHYLKMAESHLGASFMPPWASDVCEVWSDILDRLERGPEAVCGTLDWAIKLSLYGRQANSLGIRWGLDKDSHVIGEQAPGARRRRRNESEDPVHAALFASGGEGVARPGDARRRRMLEMDMRFGQLGEAGVFDSLDRAGVLEHRMAAENEIERAMAEPPGNGRARIRGSVIRQLNGAANAYCDWERIFDSAQSRVLHLSDPFVQEERWEAVHADSVDYIDFRLPDAGWRARRHPLARRERAYGLFVSGDYSGAEELLRECVNEGFEIASNRCHLARAMLMMDRELEAREEIALAWDAREIAHTYVTPRILFLRCLFAMLDGEDFSGSVMQIGEALTDGSATSSWTIEPVLNHLRSRLSNADFDFLMALAACLSGNRESEDLSVFPQWGSVSTRVPAAS